MRAALVVGIGLALVLATALWWVVDRRLKPLEPPAQAPVASTAPIDAPLQGIAAEETSAEAIGEPRADDEQPESARALLDTGAAVIHGRLLEAHCGQAIGSGVRLELTSRVGSVTELVSVAADGSFVTTQAFA